MFGVKNVIFQNCFLATKCRHMDLNQNEQNSGIKKKKNKNTSEIFIK